MIRLISTWVFPKLWKRTLPSLPTAVKKGAIGHLPFSHHGSCTWPFPPRVRLFSTECPVGKDVVTPIPEQPAERKEQIDLDGWKSLMRSQVTVDEGDDDDQGVDRVTPGGAPGDDAKEDSMLEATRELVRMWREAGKLVPLETTDEQLRELAELDTKSAKKKYLKFLALKENLKKNEKEKRQKKRDERDSMKDGEMDEEGPMKNTFLMKFWNNSMDRLLGWKGAQSMIFGQPLVFDMSYDQNMTSRELVNTVTQLMLVEACNRRSVDPFHIHYCNVQPDGAYMKELHKRYGESFDRLLITSTNRHYADVFPRERLVYLTADSPNTLRTFDHTKVYIVGALVDRDIQKGVSLANAKRLKLATARLPLDEYLQWGMGAKNLTLDQMIGILLTIKDTGKWEDALSFVPKRKHDGFSSKEGYRDRKSSGAKAKQMVYNERSEGNRGPAAYRMRNEFTDIVRERNEDRIAVSRSAGSTQDNKSAVTRLRTSLQAQLKTKTSRTNKKWWEEE